jgi:hypothetical protein
MAESGRNQLEEISDFLDRPTKFKINRILFFILYPVTGLSTFKPLRACGVS